MIAVAVNLVGNLVLIPTVGHIGPPLATALAALVNVALLYRTLRQRGHFAADDRLKRRIPRLILAALAMGGALYALDWLIDPYTTGSIVVRILGLGALVAGGALVYVVASFVTGAYRPADLRALRRRSAN
jgi:putative peptidoglycan lipid II flippase